MYAKSVCGFDCEGNNIITVGEKRNATEIGEGKNARTIVHEHFQ